MSHTTIGIPRVLWESLETTLWSHSRKYVRDLAKHLCVKEDLLLKEVLPAKENLQVYLYDCPEDAPHDMECKALVQGGGVCTGAGGRTFALRCRRTTQLGAIYCSTHTWSRPDVQPIMQRERLRRVICPEVEEEDDAEGKEAAVVPPPLWADDKGSVWDCHGNPRGYYDAETGKLYLS